MPRPPSRRQLLWTASIASCLALIVWLWWDAQTAGYAGLPVNTIGQIFGDLLMMGLAPLGATWRRSDDKHEPATARNQLSDIASARRRVQLLGIQAGFLGIAALSPDQARREADNCRGELIWALISALENGARAEILLPDPDALSTARLALGLTIDLGVYLGFLRALSDDLATLRRAWSQGRLDLRFCTTPVAISMTRCDRRVWVGLNPSVSAAAAYLAFDAASANADTAQAYFSRLFASARANVRDPDDATETDRPPLGGQDPAPNYERRQEWNSGSWETWKRGTTASGYPSEDNDSAAFWQCFSSRRAR